MPTRLKIVATRAALPGSDALSFTGLQDMLALTSGSTVDETSAEDAKLKRPRIPEWTICAQPRHEAMPGQQSPAIGVIRMIIAGSVRALPGD